MTTTQNESDTAHHLREQCSIARAGKIMGDHWTLLILRELFQGHTNYDQMTEHTGMASNILATRLRSLIQHGIITKHASPEDGRRFDYRLTVKGRALFPVLMSVMAWGDQWSSGDSGPLMELIHNECGKRTKPGIQCTACGQHIGQNNIRSQVAAAYRSKAVRNKSTQKK